jgi:AmmeMemoRadiSam system protein A
MSSNLTSSERQQLLSLARLSIQRVVCGEDLPEVDIDILPPALREDGVCFVTLTTYGDLRGCIGGLEATQPLALDVVQHAAAAATEDYRFFPVRPEELTHLHIEISRLTPAVPLEYEDPMDLPGLLHPGVDGVVLRDGIRRSTFLPQVWEKLPDPVMFLSHLCQKMGAPGDLWRRKVLKVEIYHVEEFHEEI